LETSQLIPIQTSRRQRLIHGGLAACTVLIVFLGFFFVWLPFTTRHGSKTQVPVLQGKPLAAAQNQLRTAGLDFLVNDSTFVNGTPGGQILLQYPDAGENVKPGRIIFLTVTAHQPPRVKMPRLTDLSVRSAENQLKNLGLTVEKITYREDVSEAVLGQMWQNKPLTAGTEVPKGAGITLIVGDGKKVEPVAVPEIVGKMQTEAMLALNMLGLQPQIIPDYLNPRGKAIGLVVRQKPAPGIILKPGQKVEITVISQKIILPPDTTQILPDSNKVNE
jgi:eukaryotic-like serine/threonine-protein kinase